MIRRRVRLHIEELVLDGLGPVDGTAVGRVIEQELGRLLAEQGIPAGIAGARIASELDGGTMPLRPGTAQRTIGHQVAQAVYGGMRR